ncbi:rhomboid family intramembrane serine protease [Salininema proteolyticum]|uniref:Rhomboid family intramembrane serine protease n=1 Tax=Salininema proteolyticum TaxID=1607685 RepID=A0ABV8TW60_9ACTN
MDENRPVCYRHPKRETYLSCTRCGRHICVECRNDAPVGFQCPECVREGNRAVRQGRPVLGGESGLGAKGLVTMTLIGVNVAIFLYGMVAYGMGDILGGQLTPLHAAFSFYGDPNYIAAAPFGTTELWPSVSFGGYYRFLSSMFLHYGLVHLAFNMIVLWIIGRVLEKDLGPARFLAVYFLSGIAGGVLTYYFAPGSLTAGASGAIFGLFGVMLLVNRKLSRDNTGLYVLLGLNLLITFVGSSNISWTGHIGGLVGGLACGAILTLGPQRKSPAMQWVGFVLLLAAMGVATLLQTGMITSAAGVSA